jgi:hypothetical protein
MKTVQPQVHDKSVVRDAQDGAKVKLGAMTPAFPQVKVAPIAPREGDKVRMGAMSPAFPKR